MLLVSELSDGNMHPALEQVPGAAQTNFDRFCAGRSVESTALIGLRADTNKANPGAIVDIVEHIASDEWQYGKVSANERLKADALLFPNHLGGFVFSADCYPIAIEGKGASALCHLNRTALKGQLLHRTLAAILTYEAAENLEIHVGPGSALHADMPIRILQSIKRYGLAPQIASVDPRSTFGNRQLFSRRETLLFHRKPRGNHVALVPPKPLGTDFL